MPKPQVHTLQSLPADKEREVVRRAVAAYHRAGGEDYPVLGGTYTVVGGLGYIVVHALGSSAPLAVYRLRPDNLMLRRMKRWPEKVAPRGAR
jgi:hypothetical protein